MERHGSGRPIIPYRPAPDHRSRLLDREKTFVYHTHKNLLSKNIFNDV
jgi:hypothetical protein